MKSYRQIRKIGSGSFGQVILVENNLNHQIYALKKIYNVEGKESLVQKQINLLRQLNHPNILKIIQYFYDKFGKQNCLCIVLQYCRDGDLFNYILNHKYQDHVKLQKEVISILKQIISGCIALNYKGIIHRDIKPENLLLNGKTIKIADFGCAKHIESKNKNSLSFNIGTPIYTAPQIFNQTNYNEKCDVWSVGVVLYFMIYEKVPFYETTLKKIKNLIEKKTKNEQNQIFLPNHPEVSNQLKFLLKGMLKYNQQERLTWGQISSNRIFNKKLDSIQKYMRYLGEANRIITWILQSLYSSFRQYYQQNDLCRFILLTNLYLKQSVQNMKKILNKNQQMCDYFKENLKQYKFDNLIQFVQGIDYKLTTYLDSINKKIRQNHTQSYQIISNKSGRFYLWQAQKYGRKLIIKSYQTHKKLISYKRSAYCILLITEFDRFLGEQHYLTLKSNKITQQIKNLTDSEIDRRLILQLQKFQ